MRDATRTEHRARRDRTPRNLLSFPSSPRDRLTRSPRDLQALGDRGGVQSRQRPLTAAANSSIATVSSGLPLRHSRGAAPVVRGSALGSNSRRRRRVATPLIFSARCSSPNPSSSRVRRWARRVVSARQGGRAQPRAHQSGRTDMMDLLARIYRRRGATSEFRWADGAFLAAQKRRLGVAESSTSRSPSWKA